MSDIPQEIYKELVDMVENQANDEGLFFIAKYASEAYLQQELRKLHHCIESVWNSYGEDIAISEEE